MTDGINNHATLGAATIGSQRQSQPHENRPPFLSINFIICVSGVYPSRS